MKKLLTRVAGLLQMTLELSTQALVARVGHSRTLLRMTATLQWILG
jgi:hypothetical protein